MYSEWFDQADEQRRRLAVGMRRYSTVRAQVGSDPPWEAFVSPDGELLKLAALRGETPTQREERMAKVRAAITTRRQALADTSLYGFLPGQ